MPDETGKEEDREQPQAQGGAFRRFPFDFSSSNGSTENSMALPSITAGGTVLIFLGIGTVVYHALEDWSWIDSLYFSTTALTTVGFGNIAPTTQLSELFTVFYLLFGVAAVVASLGIIGSRYLERRSVKVARRFGRKG